MADILPGVPRFLLAENNQNADGKVYIVCTDIPFLFFETVHVEAADKLEPKTVSAFSFYLNPEGNLETHYIELLAAFGDITKIDLTQIVKQAADWYTGYLGYLDGLDKVERN